MIENNIIRQSWFETSIYHVDIHDSKKINKKLVRNILKWQEKDDDGIVVSNRGGWHSQTNMHELSTFETIYTQIKIVIEQLSVHLGVDLETYKLVTSGMWANVSNKYSYNKTHNHPGAIWSCAYYVKVPKNSAKIWFVDPREQAHMLPIPFKDSQPSGFFPTVFYEPKEGTLLIFPAWLKHEVESNLIDDTRISISANFHYM